MKVIALTGVPSTRSRKLRVAIRVEAENFVKLNFMMAFGLLTLKVVCILEVFFLNQAFDLVVLYFAEKEKFCWESWGLYRLIVTSPYRN